MKTALGILMGCSCLAGAQTLLLQDTFDAPDTGNLDQSDQTGRRSGVASDIQIRSSRIQHGIAGNRLNFLNNRTGRIRFHQDPDNDTTTAGVWHNWASPSTGPLILSGGGIRVEFDWIAGNSDSNNWVSVNMGISGPGTPEPGFRVNEPETDVGLLFRFNGGTQVFDNGTGLGAQGSFTPTIGTRHVVVDFSFITFDDGGNIDVVATVDGTEVYNGTGFTWDNNLGELYFEIGTLESTLLDNVAISAITHSDYLFELSGNSFASGAPQGTLIGDLSATFQENPDTSTFTLVAGDGDTDNDKFQITGGRLEIGNFDFTGGNSVNGQQYSIRVQGTGTESLERILTLRLTKDDDFDNLTDDWEQRWVGNLTDLSAATGNEDFDSDGLSDAEELEASLLYPDIDPTEGDTDNDNLSDNEEINPTGSRPTTDPTNADTDLDGLSDEVETNTGTLVDMNDTGTDPTLCDTDGDYAIDSWEITYSTSPFDANDLPGPVGPVAIVPITNAASSGIDSSKTYTHLVSGGQTATVNGVSFELIDPEIQPVNLRWDTNGTNFNAIVNNPGDWLPLEAGADAEIEALLNSFTYSGNGAAPGNSQTFTLSGLTPGVTYDLRIYSRLWDTEGPGRPIDLVFTNGAEVVQPFGSMPLDRPNILTGSENLHDAYYLTYQYTAQGTELVIAANTQPCGPAVSGSFHMYALSNEVATGVPPGEILITNQILLDDGRFAIAFKGKPQTRYQVTKSANLIGNFLALEPALSVTTDVAGEGQAIIPASETTDLKEFYRIEE
ncbi:MAG: hypothetical protein P1U90_13090 [Akkermansiaceae bacterium]|nr:hypothetical protein [Akkermansiaceae bacterium]